MGAANAWPVVPAFTAGAPTIQQLNALSYAVSFLADQDVRPSFAFFMATATQAISATTWTSVAFDHTAYDNDHVQTYPTATIVTQGYYALEACVQIIATAGTSDFGVAAFRLTTGANNPSYTPGTNVYFGYRGGKLSSTAQAAADNAICLSDISPVPLYPLDKVAVQVFISAAHTVDINRNTTYIQGRFSTKFSGYLCATAGTRGQAWPSLIRQARTPLRGMRRRKSLRFPMPF